VVAALVSSVWLAGALTTDANFTNNPESKQADTLIKQRFGRQNAELVIVQNPALTVDDPLFRSEVAGMERQLAALGPTVVQGARSYYESHDPSVVSHDRHTTLVEVALSGTDKQANAHVPKLQDVVDAYRTGAFRVLLFGKQSVNRDFGRVAKQDLARGDTIGIIAALVILLLVFGAVVAGVIPILMGVASIVVATAGVAIVGRVFSFSYFVENMIAMMGLALGIDYSLFVISRFREERSRGRDTLAAIQAAGGTASRAVAFSGMTVVLALSGMFVVPMTIFRSLAAGAIFVAIASILAALTLLPAVLALLGDRVNSWSVLRRRGLTAGREGGLWDRIAAAVMHRPVTSVVLSAGVLMVAAAPYLGIELGFPGVSTLPARTQARQAFDVMAKDFSGGLDAPTQIVIVGNADSSAIQSGSRKLRAQLAADRSFGPSTVDIDSARDLTVVSVPVTGDPNANASVQAIGRIRNRYVPVAFAGSGIRVVVGGPSADSKDIFAMIDHAMPLALALVLGMSFVLLTVAFRSIVVALKAIVMNLLSVGAAYGVLVLVTQKGVGAGALGFHQVESIAAWLPLFLFCVLFGLSMDYHVFLLSRIREHYDQTGDNADSVAHGLRTTAGIITGAALIMVAVFAGTASGDLVMFQQMGFALGLAVLVDATIVRTVLVPASMRLLGTVNWYLPGWLQWLPRLAVEGKEGEIAGRIETPIVLPPSPVANLETSRRSA
jgi:RND superfamily putative drug exporter